jgi:hypothetical protein
LCDASQVPKPLSLQLLPFGKSDDDLGELTFGVWLFSVLSVPGGRSARVWRMVRVNSVLRVLARLRFRSVLVLSFRWKWFRTVRNSERTVHRCLADSPLAPRGRSVFRGSLLEVLFALTDGPRIRPNNLCQGADSPRYPAGRSARPIADGPPCLAGRSARG